VNHHEAVLEVEAEMSDSPCRNWQQELQQIWGTRLMLNEPMSRHTSFRIGGPAEALLIVQTLDELREVVQWATERRIPYYVIGQGTNLLVHDEGLRGIVIVNRCAGYHLTETEVGAVVFAETGISLAALARRAADASLSGLEWAASIPGSLGGAIVGNAGAFGKDMSDVLTKVFVLDTNGETFEISAADLGFAYRSSVFKEGRLAKHHGHVILAAELVLHKGVRSEIVKLAQEVTLARQRAQPLQQPSAGSVFKNPPQDYAGRLIEAAGLKGVRGGGAQVSPKHANFIVNCGSATARDVLDLIELIKSTVREQFHQELELEIVYIGQQTQATRCERKAGEDELKVRTRCSRSMWSVLSRLPRWASQRQ
jgi:UDP-N-acetylmuramate dehydrogenase